MQEEITVQDLKNIMIQLPKEFGFDSSIQFSSLDGYHFKYRYTLTLELLKKLTSSQEGCINNILFTH